MEIPQKYKDLVGRKLTFSGGIFSRKKAIEPTDFNVLDIRVGLGTIIDFKELRETGDSSYEYPTFELLLKNESMKKSQWSCSFPITEINLRKHVEKRSRELKHADLEKLSH